MMTECRAGLSVYPPDWMFKGNELMPILLATAMQRVERILERVTELPFSPVARMILQLARDEQIGAREIARVIAQDQGFTARLLKITNSPYYGQARAVTTVTQAVPVLDIDTISSLATALGALPRARSHWRSADHARDVGALHRLRDLGPAARPLHRSSRRRGDFHLRSIAQHGQDDLLQILQK
jgi:hypothetical protein